MSCVTNTWLHINLSGKKTIGWREIEKERERKERRRKREKERKEKGNKGKGRKRRRMKEPISFSSNRRCNDRRNSSYSEAKFVYAMTAKRRYQMRGVSPKL